MWDSPVPPKLFFLFFFSPPFLPSAVKYIWFCFSYILMQLAAWLKRLTVSNSLISVFTSFFRVNVFIVEGYNKESNVDDLMYQKYQIIIIIFITQ